MSKSLFTRIIETEKTAHKPPKLPKAKDKAKEQVVDAIKQAVQARAGKPVSMIYPNFNPKGFDSSFKEGGQFKLRPKSGGVVLAKLYGLPKHGDRWLGVGKSVPEALANMKPEAPGAPEDLEAPEVTQTEPVAPAASTTPVSPPVKPAKPKKDKGQLPKPAQEKTPGPEREVIGGQALHNDIGVDQETFDRYAGALKDATEMYQRRGFGFMLGKFTMHLRKGKPGILGNYTGAAYSSVNPEVEMFVNNLDKGNHDDLALTMIHEIAHHYYYKEIPRSLRKTYDWYFKKSKEFASDYGKSSRYEDFPEIIASFVGRAVKRDPKIMKYHPLTQEQVQRVRTFLSQDKRINLKGEEKDSMFGRVILGDGA